MKSGEHDPRLNRRAALTGIAGAAAWAGGLGRSVRAEVATPLAEGTPVYEETEYLAVADPAAKTVSIFNIPDGSLIEVVDGVAVNTHAGFLPSPDGQLLLMDDAGKRLMAIEVHGDHLHMHEAAIPGTAFSHFGIDSDHAHLAAVGSDDPASPITLVYLETWETIPVPLQDPGEVGLFLNHDILFHRNGNLNRIEAYVIADLREGRSELLSTVEIGAGGHGESISTSGDTLYTATDDGIDVVAWDGTDLTFLTTYPWESADRQGGRGYFQRLSLDGGTLVSYTADRTAPETDWATWTNDAVLIDIADGVTRRIELGNGYVYRFGLADGTALFSRIGGDGDEAIVLDIATGEIAQRLPLEPMMSGPVAGSSIYDTNQYRAVTMTTGGRFGFVSRGGDGEVTVLDLATGRVSGTIAVGSPLNGGGYLGIFGAATSFSDTIAR